MPSTPAKSTPVVALRISAKETVEPGIRLLRQVEFEAGSFLSIHRLLFLCRHLIEPIELRRLNLPHYYSNPYVIQGCLPGVPGKTTRIPAS